MKGGSCNATIAKKSIVGTIPKLKKFAILFFIISLPLNFSILVFICI